jgi:hypothetical protein
MHRMFTGASRLVAALALLAAPVPAQTNAQKLYRSPNYKFSLNVFNEWNEVPVAVGDDNEVAKFYEPGSKGDVFRPELTVFRLSHKGDGNGTNEGPTTGDKPKIPKEIADEIERRRVKSMYQLAFNRLINFDEKKWPEDKNWKEVNSKDHIKGKFWAIELPFAEKATKDDTLLALLFTYEKEGVEYGARLTCSARRRDTYEGEMKGIAKSFLFFDDKAKDVAKLTVLDGINISPARRTEIEKGLIKGWDVIVSPKKNYVVVYNTKGDRNKELAHVLAERIEKIREQIYEKQFPPSKPVDTVSVMRVCGDAAEYHAYGGPGGSAGYWNSGSEELVFYDASPSQRVDDNTLAVLYHEAFHQFIYYSVGKVAPHSWFNEGTGDYFAGAKYGGGKFTIRPFNWRIATIQKAIRNGPCPYQEKTDGDETQLKFDRANEGYSPLKALVKMTQSDYYSYPYVSYAEGWSFIYFLREAVPKNPKWSEKWGKILDTYFNVLKEEVNKKRPLAPVKPPPDDPGMDEPGMGEPGMGEPGSDDPGMDDPGMSDPGMDDPGMSDPGMDDPGMSDPGMGEPPPDAGGIPIPSSFSRFGDDSAALRKAVDEAFKDIDFEELEKAWKESTLKVK